MSKKRCPNRTLFSAAALFLVALAFPSVASAKLEVVATVGDLARAVEEVGGERVEVTALARPDEDPHYVDAKPSFVRRLSKADALVYNGMSLEIGWLPELLDNARNANIQTGATGNFDASTVIQRMGVPDTEVTRKMGDVHPEGNPHYTLDPRQMARVAIGLGKRLGELDSKHEEAYRKRARAFAKECLEVAQKWEEKFASLPAARRSVVVYHENWEYVTDWLDLQKVATVEPKPGVEPNPKHVAEVVKAIEDRDVRALLQMEYYPSSTVDQIAEKTRASVITSRGQTRNDQKYVDRIDDLAAALYESLSE